jgi:sugar lactone lactonase YvrE
MMVAWHEVPGKGKRSVPPGREHPGPDIGPYSYPPGLRSILIKTKAAPFREHGITLDASNHEHLAEPFSTGKLSLHMGSPSFLGKGLLPFHRQSLAAGLVLLGLLATQGWAQTDPKLQQIAGFPDQQVTGITVAGDGRIFLCFPYWSDPHSVSVARLDANSTLTPYPDQSWNRAEGPPSDHFICVQSVIADDQNNLWVLDPGAIKHQNVTPNGAKLVKIDLSTNAVVDKIVFPEVVVPANSYLNDVRFDTQNGYAFISDSGIGGLVVVDLRNKQARRVLAENPSTKAEPEVLLKIEGVPLVNEKTGKSVQVNADGIEIDKANGYLYYQALIGRTLYRIKLTDLENGGLADSELGKRVETVATVPAADGLAFRDNFIYFTAIEQDAIDRLNLDSRELSVVVKDARLKWPDTLSFGPDGSLYVTNSQIHLTPRFNHGVNKVKEPFGVYKITNP